MRLEYIELRKDPRISTEVEISYFTLGDESMDDPVRPRPTAMLTDVAKGGAGLLIEEPFHPNAPLVIEGVNGGGPRRQDCTVQWVKKARSKYKVGVKFNGHDS